ncbi:MAG: hypothetical protein ABIP71_15265 [Verrucomicrobiota bacterium]
MRRYAIILLWGLLFFILPAVLVCAIVGIYYSQQYPNAFSYPNVLTEGRIGMRMALDRLRPVVGVLSVTGLILGIILGVFEKLPGTKLKSKQLSE